MKKAFLAVSIGLVAILLAACSGESQATQAPSASIMGGPTAATEAPSRANAPAEPSAAGGNLARQLLLGLVKLGETELALTPEQADRVVTVLTAWKTGTIDSDESSETLARRVAELQAILTVEQVEAIQAMALSPEETQAVFESLGLTMVAPGGAGGNGPDGGGGQPQGGPGQPRGAGDAPREGEFGASDAGSLPPAANPPAGARADVPTQGGPSGQLGAGTMIPLDLVDAVIRLLSESASS